MKTVSPIADDATLAPDPLPSRNSSRHAADALQIFVFPFFAEGFSPADDVLGLAVAAILVHPLGWHWEFLPAFLPAFAVELVPGVDLVPFWTLQSSMSTAIGNRSRSTRRKLLSRSPRTTVLPASKGKITAAPNLPS
jgi:hypothetical protein